LGHQKVARVLIESRGFRLKHGKQTVVIAGQHTVATKLIVNFRAAARSEEQSKFVRL